MAGELNILHFYARQGNPCRPDCQRRTPTCHIDCADYAAYRAKREALYKERAAKGVLEAAEDERNKKIEKKRRKIKR